MAGKKKRGLGRGLDALLGEAALPRAESPQTLPLERIEPGRFQPRRDIDPERLAELAESIRAHGVVQPVVVRPRENDRYELIAGERRWRASRLAGLTEIPVVVRRLDDRTALALALIENIQREDLNPLEQAEALCRLLEEFDMTHQQLAEAVGKSRTTITNLLRLLDLEPEVRQLLAEGRIEMGHARALLGLAGEQQVQIARQVADGKLTVRATEALVKKLQQPREKSRQDRPDPDILRLQEELSSLLGAPVTIRHGRGGKGSLVIRYSDLEQLEGLLTRMR
ncbi:ParB family transcriptional regulator, chromosome partitioning protein [Methylomarinovum caldicuralii]|uniref:Probable chromosome-partitioning protein ParB n=1 Tax=Methylomarinovum caldicuralii TaxID=438856 RepID=A0AAU9BRQ6_9GAMM|nr:ParB/RepB/Spo0J family partition protein [Methylomarinovum caldicuralii]BCX81191.1 ParB family transcriptional regulator, chromosome partitioning protein [Methylomarinovum caldicuralii]